MPVEQSPISAPRPELGPESVQPGAMTRREMWGYVFWGVLGVVLVLVPEVLAAFWDDMPFPTISGTIGHLEREHSWFSIIVLGGIVTLGARIVFYPWPNRRAER
jgi:hypothetical protein